MPNYKGHIIGGIVTFSAVYLITTKVFAFRPFTPKTFLLAFSASMLGALFPDIDTKSVIQRIFYALLIIPMAVAIMSHNWLLLASLSLISIFPILVNHRGIIHTVWFVTISPLALPALAHFLYPSLLTHAWIAYGYFVAGALSHLFLDLA